MTSTIRSMSSVGPQRWPPRDYPRRQPAGTLCTIRSAGAQTSATPAAEPDGAVDLDRSAAAFVARTATRALCLRLLRAAPPVRHAAPRVSRWLHDPPHDRPRQPADRPIRRPGMPVDRHRPRFPRAFRQSPSCGACSIYSVPCKSHDHTTGCDPSWDYRGICPSQRK